MKFIHAADIHLDSPLIGLQKYDGAPVEEIRVASRRAFQNLVELAVSEKAYFILIAGDLYDGDWKDYNTGLFLSSQMSRLREEGIKVFIIAGNHDAASQITKHLRMPDNVKNLSVKSTETVILDELGVAIHGRGYYARAIIEDLVAGYPQALPHYLNIGLLHTSLDGREGHEPYAPTTIQSLLSKGYDYWALGHVHKREVVCKEPWVIFPGNIQGRHVREVGPKGCTLVSIDDGHIACTEHRDLDVMRWIVIFMDARQMSSVEDLREQVSDNLTRAIMENHGIPLAMRLEITGPSKVHRELLADPDHWKNEIRAVATDVSGGTIWIEKIRVNTSDMLDFDSIAAKSDAIGELMKSMDDLSNNDSLLQAAVETLKDLNQRLPHELKTGDDALNLEDPAIIKNSVERVRQYVMSRILSKGTEL